MMKYMLTASIVMLGFLAGCTAQPASSQGHGTTKQATPDQTMPFDTISLTRSACFGRCPVYAVTLHADGRVEYDGKHWVAMTGKHSGNANTQAMQDLAALLESRRLPLIVDYRPGKPACGQATTDMPGATITIKQDDTTRTLYYYMGCQNVPDWLPALAEQIDQAAGSGRWVGGKQTGEILKHPH